MQDGQPAYNMLIRFMSKCRRILLMVIRRIVERMVDDCGQILLLLAEKLFSGQGLIVQQLIQQTESFPVPVSMQRMFQKVDHGLSSGGKGLRTLPRSCQHLCPGLDIFRIAGDGLHDPGVPLCLVGRRIYQIVSVVAEIVRDVVHEPVEVVDGFGVFG